VRNESLGLWDALDPEGPSRVVWLRPPPQRRVVVLMGAFDPPTNAHLAVLRGAAGARNASGVLCLTKTLLARPPDELLPVADRLTLLGELAEHSDLGLAIANRGTYVEVSEALATTGTDASFVIGSDKLAQLEDASFYPDGEEGVRRTFSQVAFVVVPRPDRTGDRPGLVWLDPDDVFTDGVQPSLSATEVRERLRRGEQVEHLVPPPVALALAGYTSF
jgi:nicotinic acid mononucleotide adenylyltransferase